LNSELTQLRDELAKRNTHETSFLRGCIADLVKDKADRNLLNICLNAGVLQDFFQDTAHDIFFIARCRSKLVKEFFMDISAVEKALGYCQLVAGKKTNLEVVQSLSIKSDHVTIPLTERGSYWNKNILLWTVDINDSNTFVSIESRETSDGREFFLLWFRDPEDAKVKYSLPISGSEENETFELWECTSNRDFKSNGITIKKGTKKVRCYSVE